MSGSSVGVAVGTGVAEVRLGVAGVGSRVGAGVGVARGSGVSVGLGPGVAVRLALRVGVTLGLGVAGDDDMAPTAAARSSRPACQNEPVPGIRFAVPSKRSTTAWLLTPHRVAQSSAAAPLTCAAARLVPSLSV